MFKYHKTICLVALFLKAVMEAKVRICAHYFGQPEFVKYQHKFFQKNVKDDYELIVFEDSMDPVISREIQKECEKYGIAYVKIPREEFDHPKIPLMNPEIGLHSPSFECSVATQYIYDHYVVSHDDICLILDNDIFLLKPFHFRKYLGEYSFAYVPQSRGHINYMLPNFLIINPKVLKDKESFNFNMGIIDGYATDSAGFTHFYLQKHFLEGRVIPVLFLWGTTEYNSYLKKMYDQKYSMLFNLREWSSHFFIEEDSFLHIRMGSNWANHPHYKRMMFEVNCLFNDLLEVIL